MTMMRQSTSILPLHVQGLCFEADGKRLIDAISFSLPKGGITALLGPNGAGKSLTLRLCHGLLKPSAGTINWQTEQGETNGRKRHAMVFQRPVMLRRSVASNMAHALNAVGSTEPGRAEAALARFGLLGLAERPARLLSGGEQQRLAIARAWAMAPEVLFLDEPTAHLDPGATRQIEQIIAALAAEGMTIMMSSHDLNQARRLSQRVLFLDRGQLVESQPASSFFSNPATAQARAFIAGDLLW